MNLLLEDIVLDSLSSVVVVGFYVKKHQINLCRVFMRFFLKDIAYIQPISYRVSSHIN